MEACCGEAVEREGDLLSEEELEQALKAMKKRKAPGVDGIPIELYLTEPRVP